MPRLTQIQETHVDIIRKVAQKTGASWDRKVVLITGASEGIGPSCAKLLEKRGARLSLTAVEGGGPDQDGFRDSEIDLKVVTVGDITSPVTRHAAIERTLDHF